MATISMSPILNWVTFLLTFPQGDLEKIQNALVRELARIEGDMLEAREKSANLEYTIFMRIREEVVSISNVCNN